MATEADIPAPICKTRREECGNEVDQATPSLLNEPSTEEKTQVNKPLIVSETLESEFTAENEQNVKGGSEETIEGEIFLLSPSILEVSSDTFKHTEPSIAQEMAAIETCQLAKEDVGNSFKSEQTNKKNLVEIGSDGADLEATQSSKNIPEDIAKEEMSYDSNEITTIPILNKPLTEKPEGTEPKSEAYSLLQKDEMPIQKDVKQEAAPEDCELVPHSSVKESQKEEENQSETLQESATSQSNPSAIEKIEENSLIQVDGSHGKLDEQQAKEYEEASRGISNDDTSLVTDEVKTEDDALTKAIKSTLVHKGAQNEKPEEFRHQAGEKFEVSASGKENETSSLEDQILTANQLENNGDKAEEKTVDAVERKEETLEKVSTVANEETEDPNITVAGSEMKHEEFFEKEHNNASEPTCAEPLTNDSGDNKSTSTHKATFENEDLSIPEMPASVESASLDMKVPTPGQEIGKTISADEKSPTPEREGIVDDNIEEKTADLVGMKEQFLELQNAAPIVLNEGIEVHEQVDATKREHDELVGKPSGDEVSARNANDDELIIMHKCNNEDEGLKKDEQLEEVENTESPLSKEEESENKAVEPLPAAAEDIKKFTTDEATETANSLEEQSFVINPQEILDHKTDERKIELANEKDKILDVPYVATIFSTTVTDENSLIQVECSELEQLKNESGKPSLAEASDYSNADESRGAHEECEDLGKAELFSSEKNQENTVLKKAETEISNEYLATAPEDTEASISEDITTTSFVKEHILVSSPRGIMEDKTEGETIDETDTKMKNLEASNVSTLISHERTEEKLVNYEDAVQMKYEEHLEEEKEKSSLALDNTPRIMHEDTILVEDQNKAEQFGTDKISVEDQCSQENMSDQTEGTTVGSIDMKEKSLESQHFTTTVSDDIEGKPLIQAEDSEIKHEEHSENQIEEQSSVGALTGLASDDGSTIEHETNIEIEDHKDTELIENDKKEGILLEREAEVEKLNESSEVTTKDIAALFAGRDTKSTSSPEEQSHTKDSEADDETYDAAEVTNQSLEVQKAEIVPEQITETDSPYGITDPIQHLDEGKLTENVPKDASDIPDPNQPTETWKGTLTQNQHTTEDELDVTRVLPGEEDIDKPEADRVIESTKIIQDIDAAHEENSLNDKASTTDIQSSAIKCNENEVTTYEEVLPVKGIEKSILTEDQSYHVENQDQENNLTSNEAAVDQTTETKDDAKNTIGQELGKQVQEDPEITTGDDANLKMTDDTSLTAVNSEATVDETNNTFQEKSELDGQNLVEDTEKIHVEGKTTHNYEGEMTITENHSQKESYQEPCAYIDNSTSSQPTKLTDATSFAPEPSEENSDYVSVGKAECFSEKTDAEKVEPDPVEHIDDQVSYGEQEVEAQQNTTAGSGLKETDEEHRTDDSATNGENKKPEEGDTEEIKDSQALYEEREEKQNLDGGSVQNEKEQEQLIIASLEVPKQNGANSEEANPEEKNNTEVPYEEIKAEKEKNVEAGTEDEIQQKLEADIYDKEIGEEQHINASQEIAEPNEVINDETGPKEINDAQVPCREREIEMQQNLGVETGQEEIDTDQLVNVSPEVSESKGVNSEAENPEESKEAQSTNREEAELQHNLEAGSTNNKKDKEQLTDASPEVSGPHGVNLEEADPEESKAIQVPHEKIEAKIQQRMEAETTHMEIAEELLVNPSQEVSKQNEADDEEAHPEKIKEEQLHHGQRDAEIQQNLEPANGLDETGEKQLINASPETSEPNGKSSEEVDPNEYKGQEVPHDKREEGTHQNLELETSRKKNDENHLTNASPEVSEPNDVDVKKSAPEQKRDEQLLPGDRNAEMQQHMEAEIDLKETGEEQPQNAYPEISEPNGENREVDPKESQEEQVPFGEREAETQVNQEAGMSPKEKDEDQVIDASKEASAPNGVNTEEPDLEEIKGAQIQEGEKEAETRQNLGTGTDHKETGQEQLMNASPRVSEPNVAESAEVDPEKSQAVEVPYTERETELNQNTSHKEADGEQLINYSTEVPEPKGVDSEEEKKVDDSIQEVTNNSKPMESSEVSSSNSLQIIEPKPSEKKEAEEQHQEQSIPTLIEDSIMETKNDTILSAAVEEDSGITQETQKLEGASLLNEVNSRIVNKDIKESEVGENETETADNTVVLEISSSKDIIIDDRSIVEFETKPCGEAPERAETFSTLVEDQAVEEPRARETACETETENIENATDECITSVPKEQERGVSSGTSSTMDQIADESKHKDDSRPNDTIEKAVGIEETLKDDDLSDDASKHNLEPEHTMTVPESEARDLLYDTITSEEATKTRKEVPEVEATKVSLDKVMTEEILEEKEITPEAEKTMKTGIPTEKVPEEDEVTKDHDLGSLEEEIVSASQQENSMLNTEEIFQATKSTNNNEEVPRAFDEYQATASIREKIGHDERNVEEQNETLFENESIDKTLYQKETEDNVKELTTILDAKEETQVSDSASVNIQNKDSADKVESSTAMDDRTPADKLDCEITKKVGKPIVNAAEEISGTLSENSISESAHDDEDNRTSADKLDCKITKNVGEPVVDAAVKVSGMLAENTVPESAPTKQRDEISSSDYTLENIEANVTLPQKDEKKTDENDDWSRSTEEDNGKSSREAEKLDLSPENKDVLESSPTDDAQANSEDAECSRIKYGFLDEGHLRESTEFQTSTITKGVEMNSKATIVDTGFQKTKAETDTGAVSEAIEMVCTKQESPASTLPTISKDFELKEDGSEGARVNVDMQKTSAETDFAAVPEATGCECKQEEKESDDCKGIADNSTKTETNKISTPEIEQGNTAGNLQQVKDQETEDQLTKLRDKPQISHANDSDAANALDDGASHIQSARNLNVDELNKSSAATSNQNNLLKPDHCENKEAKVSSEGDEAEAIPQGPVSNSVIPETEEPRAGKASPSVSEQREMDSEENNGKSVNCQSLEEEEACVTTLEVSPSNVLQGPATDAAQDAKSQDTQKQQDVLPVITDIKYSDKETAQIGTLECTHETELDTASIPAKDKHVLPEADCTENTTYEDSDGSKTAPHPPHGYSPAEAEIPDTTPPQQEQSDCAQEKTISNEAITPSTEAEKHSLSDLLQAASRKQTPAIADQLTADKETTIHKEATLAEKPYHTKQDKSKSDEEKHCEEESTESLIMVEAEDIDTKVHHKKSHNILSGVGSKVKHSISKVKKAITGKSSHPKPPSPKQAEKQ